jgi:hypothetical protein
MPLENSGKLDAAGSFAGSRDPRITSPPLHKGTADAHKVVVTYPTMAEQPQGRGVAPITRRAG